MTTDPETIARAFHDAYERLAPQFGYETREASAVPWDDVPENNRRLMTAVAAEILTLIAADPSDQTATKGGPWTRHGHPVRGVTVAGDGRPPIARCGGPGMCDKCSIDEAQIRREAAS